MKSPNEYLDKDNGLPTGRKVTEQGFFVKNCEND